VYPAPETDNEEVARVRAALANLDRILCERLLAAAKPGGYEASFLRRDPATFDQADRLTLRRIAYFYRLRLPAHLRPRKNPDDPIVREMELLDG
jgi:hypothetical protein